ncbi:MAG TPA: GNAT family N-acetyltransferase [Candidatus Thermoplasmatota archaeon]|nr:GNAT family N-acetyltransferase [Candidatus Thermoplasmatota archaeon]
MPGRLTVQPVTPQQWPDLERLFSARGSPHYCWCTPCRFADAHTMDKAARKAAMEDCVRAGTPVGVLAYRGGEPVGWCSIAPREAYAKLERSRAMPQVEEGAWAVLCFFVRRAERGKDLPPRLLKGGTAYAKANGARLVEGYPWDTLGITSRHRGHSSVFAAAGFRQEGRRWVRRFRVR